MTLTWLEQEIKSFMAVHQVAPAAAEISETDMVSLLFDLGGLKPTPAAIQAGFLCAGVSVEVSLSSKPGSLTLVYPPALGMGWSWTHYTAPGVPPLLEKPGCDCGAKKTGQPGHSNWCSTQVSA